MIDYTSIWKELNDGKHVLLFIDAHDDDPNLKKLIFERRLESLRDWFSPIITAQYGKSDFLMKNNAFLCVRLLSSLPSYPFNPEDEGIKVMVIRHGR